MIEHNLISFSGNVIEKLMDNGKEPREEIITKYLRSCPNGTKRIEDYETYLSNQFIFAWNYYDILFDLEEFSIEECSELIEWQNDMLKGNKKFLKQNEYFLKPFPMYQKMCENYIVQKHYVKCILNRRLQKQIQKIKKENGIL